MKYKIEEPAIEFRYWSFIYDDYDNSVRYCEHCDASELIGDLNLCTGELFVLGFEGVGSVLAYKTLCSYHMGSLDFQFDLSVTAGGVCYVQVYITGTCSRFSIYRIADITVSGNKMLLMIPARMLLYVLDICSRKDFDELMGIFCNLFGNQACSYVDFINDDRISNIRWNDG